MRIAICAIVAVMTASTEPSANFLRISVTAHHPVALRAIWRPYAGAVGSHGEVQQGPLRNRNWGAANRDSVRRWQDPAARDTVSVKSPTMFVVDMTGGPVVIEAVSADSIRVEAQLMPGRGPVVAAWGRRVLVMSDGIMPRMQPGR